MSGRELELKSVVPDADALLERLERAGATRFFRGRLIDRRYDLPGGTLLGRDEVLRLRVFQPDEGEMRSEIAWKGPTNMAGTYKERQELQVGIADAARLGEILSRIGLVLSMTIERCVALYGLAGAVVRVEWYPRMDVLVEVEGEPAAIESAVAVTGLDRASFTAEPLPFFAARYEARTGRRAALSLSDLDGEAPAWPAWAL